MARRGPNEGTIYQRKDGRWEGKIFVRYDLDGRAKTISVYGKSRKEVQDKLRDLADAKRNNELIEPHKTTLGQWLDYWLENHAETRVSASTYELYYSLIRLHIKPILGYIKLLQLRPSDIQQFYTKKLKEGKASQTVRHMHTVLKGSLKQAARESMIPRNIMDLVDPPKIIRREIRPLTREEIEVFLEVIKKSYYYPLFMGYLFTGLRRGELLALHWRDVDLEKGTLTVTETLNRHKRKDKNERTTNTELLFGRTKTKSSRRTIPLPEVLIELLREHKAKQEALKNQPDTFYQDTDLVFATQKGTPIEPNSVLRALKSILKKNKLPQISVHDLRHTFATLLLSLGENPKVVAEMMGHSNASVTIDVYSHVVPGLKELAVKKLDAFLKEKGPAE
ncbi:MAG: site-specific integrase [Firmicutes bacterium]|nr:site-specific integrase [Bacillota bacterium]